MGTEEVPVDHNTADYDSAWHGPFGFFERIQTMHDLNDYTASHAPSACERQFKQVTWYIHDITHKSGQITGQAGGPQRSAH